MAKKTALPVTARLGSPRRPNRWMTAARPPPRPSSSGAGGVGGVAGRGGGVASPTDGADGRGIPVVGGGSGGGPRKWALKEARAVRRGVAALAVLTAACATLLYVLAVGGGGGGVGGGRHPRVPRLVTWRVCTTAARAMATGPLLPRRLRVH